MSVRAHVVVNPRSGGGRAGKTFGDVHAVLERRLGPVDVSFTARPGHAIDLARDAARAGAKLLVAVGGDGTMHEVANGVLEAGGDAVVGYVGQGTGGDFRRTLAIDHRLDAYVDAIASGHDRRIDVGKVVYRAGDGAVEQSRWFVNVLSAGMGGLVVRYVGALSRVLGGKAAYYWASVRALATAKRGHLRCEVGLEGEKERRQIDSYLIAICNGRYFGGGMHIAPMASPDDGRFEVVSFDAQSKLAFPDFSKRVYAGTHLARPGALHFACDRISIALENQSVRDVFLLEVDGEPLGGLPLDVEVVPRALTVRASA
jgi:YegS/Rv2252/BmrU family lipid kinase